MRSPLSELLDKEAWQQLQDEARTANDLQKQGMARTEALRCAKRLIEKSKKETSCHA
ncbi:hypothetical protein [Magnetospirillum molischianum]|uniref:Uncharacterized protein n=1 Tax=Magnetospirillum molischianum DSM 120 TaxID=1150626 RepID=H8FYB0_MAGML|nr:hypothetical protein [Magnetospirillum molischianum]CCG43348.1 hypothetical protein PHAMO_80139 [Magnetospirillum molischianum DSM 120]